MATHTSCLNIAFYISLLILVHPCESRAQGTANQSPIFQTVDLVMYEDPTFEYVEPIFSIPDTPIPVWERALARDDDQLLRVTMDAIAKAHRLGMKGTEVFLPRLVEILDNKRTALSVRRSAVATLIELGSTDHSSLLAEQTRQYGQSIGVFAEPALATWKSDAFLEDWIDRLEDAVAGDQALVNAMQGVSTLKATDATESLKRFVADRSRASRVRLAAGRALGKMHIDGLQDVAGNLIDNNDRNGLDDLLAVALLEQHTDRESIDLLKQLVGRKSSIVQASALNRLAEIDSGMLLTFVDELVTSHDVNVRRPIARAMIDAKSANWIEALAALLGDVNPGLRREVASALFDLAEKDDLRDEVVAETSRILAQDEWRGCEQAAMVLVNLDAREISDRLEVLLDHPRGEVTIAAAWGLRRFKQMEHLPAMLRRAEKVHRGLKKGELTIDSVGPEGQVAQLFMAFGEMRFGEAEPLMKKYLPKDFTLGDEARTAAVWAIGLLNEGNSPPALVRTLLQRMNDWQSEFPEIGSVRGMCAMSLARMKSESSVPNIREYALENGSFVSQSCWWALQQLVGDTPPPLPPPFEQKYTEWFLSPIQMEIE